MYIHRYVCTFLPVCLYVFCQSPLYLPIIHLSTYFFLCFWRASDCLSSTHECLFTVISFWCTHVYPSFSFSSSKPAFSGGGICLFLQTVIDSPESELTCCWFKPYRSGLCSKAVQVPFLQCELSALLLHVPPTTHSSHFPLILPFTGPAALSLWMVVAGRVCGRLWHHGPMCQVSHRCVSRGRMEDTIVLVSFIRHALLGLLKVVLAVCKRPTWGGELSPISSELTTPSGSVLFSLHGALASFHGLISRWISSFRQILN